MLRRKTIYFWISRICLICVFITMCLAGLNFATSYRDCSFDSDLGNQYIDDGNGDAITVDFASLKARNADTVGWIRLPDTILNYPVVQCTNNWQYLNQRFDGAATEYGTIFADHRSDLKDGNNIILYGHNQGKFNPVKFTLLNNYVEDSMYINSHPYFEFYNAETGERTVYKIFSVIRADVTTQENIDKYYLPVKDGEYKKYLEWLQSQTIVTSEVKVNEKKQAMILSTCTDDAYWQRILVCGLAN